LGIGVGLFDSDRLFNCEGFRIGVDPLLNLPLNIYLDNSPLEDDTVSLILGNSKSETFTIGAKS
jgi:hypothetical protein